MGLFFPKLCPVCCASFHDIIVHPQPHIDRHVGSETEQVGKIHHSIDEDDDDEDEYLIPHLSVSLVQHVTVSHVSIIRRVDDVSTFGCCGFHLSLQKAPPQCV